MVILKIMLFVSSANRQACPGNQELLNLLNLLIPAQGAQGEPCAIFFTK